MFFAQLALLAALTQPPAEAQTATALYVAALRRMEQTREPSDLVYRAVLHVPNGGIYAERPMSGVLHLQFGLDVNGPDEEDFFVRTTSSTSTYVVELPTRQLATSRLSLLNATWRGIDDWMRYGFEGNPSRETPSPAPSGPQSETPEQLHVIAIVQTFGLLYYTASDGGPGSCANGDAGHVINLQPRSGDPLAHPLRSVTIDQTTGLFCTMRFDAPASADIGYSSIAHVTLNMAEIKGYYLVQNELIDMVATAPRSLDYRIRATIVFDAFTGLKP